MPQENREASSDSGSRHMLEWIIAALGALIVLVSIAFLAYQALSKDQAPPDIAFGSVSVAPVSGGYLIQFTIHNTGDRTAAKLKITASLIEGQSVIETSEVSLDYAPANSVRNAGAFFSNDPRKYEVRIRAEGYARP